MGIIKEIIILSAGIILSLTSGGNNSAINPAVLMGSGILKRKTAVFFCALGILAGVIINATLMINYGSTLIVNGKPDELLSIMISSIVTLILLSAIGVPTSVSQLVIVSIAGFAAAGIFMINWNYFLFTVISWIVSVVVSVFLSAFFYNIFYRYSFLKPDVGLSFKIKFLIVFMSLYNSYLVGANVIGFIISIIRVSSIQIGYTELLLINGIAGALGLLIMSKRIFIEVGFRLSRLGRIATVSALLSSNIIIQFFTAIGIPISVTQTITGSLIGINLAKGSLRVGSSMKMFKNWIIAPIIGTTISLFVYLILNFL
ncbi:MAG: inorganic phosphate transporter [Thermoprotei archaeon]